MIESCRTILDQGLAATMALVTLARLPCTVSECGHRIVVVKKSEDGGRQKTKVERSE